MSDIDKFQEHMDKLEQEKRDDHAILLHEFDGDIMHSGWIAYCENKQK